MTLLNQIDEARRALDGLKTDETELARLNADQLAEIQTLKASGSKDFLLLSNLEAKRAALATLLTEQQGLIASAQAQLVSLEAQRRKSEQLAQIRERVAGLQARRQETDALLLELSTLLVAQLGRITAARVIWAAELQEAVDLTRETYGLAYLEAIDHNGGRARSGWNHAFDEIGSGALDALLISPSDRSLGGIAQPYPRPGYRSAQSEVQLIGMAKQPLIRFLDRTVTLTIAEALDTADQAAPHPFAGGER